MKKITYILSAVACLAALLTSCVKEESYTREVAELNIDLTPIEENGSVVQGDAITDAMIWAFQCTLNDETGAPTISDGAKAVGARYVYDLNTYGSISVHVPLPICNGSQDYLLVAVINTQAYGNFNLTSDSTWGAIKAATFGNGGAFWSKYPNDVGKTPEVMPISNWTTFTITSDNTHDDNCYQLNLPVYRTVSKAQFLVAKATGDFDLDILDVKVVANSGYSTGALLTASPETADGDNSEKIQRGKPDATATSWWWASPTAVTRAEGATAPAITYQLKNSDSGFSPVNNVTTEVSADDHGDDATYAWIGSTFLFENNNDADYGETGCYDAAQGDGYNLYVKYSVNDEEYEVYTPLGKVVRNHDYQVRALVEAGGKLSLSLVVNEWVVDDDNNWNFTDNVSVTANGKLSWDVDGNDNVKINEAETQITLPQTGINTNNKAQCKFTFDTPRDGAKWMASFVGGDVNAFKFIDENDNLVNTISGTIDGEESILKICTTENSVKDTKQAELDIVVVTGDGRTLSASVVFKNGRPMIIQELTM